MSPVGVGEDHKRLRIIRDIPFDHKDWNGGRSIILRTDWDEIGACALDGFMHQALQRVLGFMVKLGNRVRIIILKVDAKNAFRQISIDAEGAAVLGDVLGVPFGRSALASWVAGQPGVVGRDISCNPASTT